MGPKAQLGFHSFIGLSLLHEVCFRLLYVTVHKGVILQLCPTIHQAYSRNMPILDQVSKGILGLLSLHRLASWALAMSLVEAH